MTLQAEISKKTAALEKRWPGYRSLTATGELTERNLTLVGGKVDKGGEVIIPVRCAYLERKPVKPSKATKSEGLFL